LLPCWTGDNNVADRAQSHFFSAHSLQSMTAPNGSPPTPTSADPALRHAALS
jgi:hypothetical protein